MNFTHLLDAGALEPSQLDLQRYDYYLVAVVLSDDMAEEVRQHVGYDFRAARKTLCWIVQPRHLQQAPLGSALNRIYEALSRNKVFPHADHSFITWCSREQLRLHSDHPGYYRELLLATIPTTQARCARLREVIAEALEKCEAPPKSLLSVATAVGPYVKLLTELVKYCSKGSP